MLKTPDICEMFDFMDIEQYAFNILFEEFRKAGISHDEAKIFIPIIYEFDWSEPLSALLKISDKNFYTKLPETLPIIKSIDIIKFLAHFNFSLVY